jgi:hypothetical protein
VAIAMGGIEYLRQPVDLDHASRQVLVLDAGMLRRAPLRTRRMAASSSFDPREDAT